MMTTMLGGEQETDKYVYASIQINTEKKFTGPNLL